MLKLIFLIYVILNVHIVVPEYSSQWLQEIKKFGGYKITPEFNSYEKLVQNNSVPIDHDDYNPYIEAFWKWWEVII